MRNKLGVCILITVFTFRLPSFSQSAEIPKAYPKTVGFLSVSFPVVTINKNETTTNFTHSTIIGFPFGLNILYSDRFGLSYEVSPVVKSVGGISKVSSIGFHPGLLFRFHHGFNFISRLAFETSGRYGFTPVFNKVLVRSKALNYYMSASLPVRFGNEDPASIGGTLQFGIVFN